MDCERIIRTTIGGIATFSVLAVSVGCGPDATETTPMRPADSLETSTAPTAAEDQEVVVAAECDRDNDGVSACVGSEPFDCDDNEWYTNPYQDEICDGLDNNCDGETDELITNCQTATIPGPDAAPDDNVPFDGPANRRPTPPAGPWPAGCVDSDRDGWPACDPEGSFAHDCDDADVYTAPSQDEICDGVDNNCDGETDEFITNCETATIPGPPAAD